MNKRRVVVTGLGCITPVGNNINDFWNSLLSGKSGVRNIDVFDASEMSVKFSASINDFNAEKYFDVKEQRKLDLFMQYGLAAAIDAVNDSTIDNSELDGERIGVCIGSGIGGLSSIENTHDTLKKSGPRRISPFFIPATIINMISGNLSIKYGFKGPNSSIVTACTTGTHNIGEGFRQIQYSHADIMLCGGAEMATTPLGIGGFAAARALSTRNEAPEQASRPWDTERDGFVLGDGAGVLVLEELEHAKARGAKIYGELTGYGATSDGFDMVQPSGEGAERCMKQVLKNIDGKIDYINTHGTSTPIGDVKELDAIKNVFGANIPKMSSTKSLTGHSLGATGVHEAIYSLLMMKNNFISGSANIDKLDDSAKDCNILLKTEHDVEIENVMSNSFGFGGTNATLVFSKYHAQK